MKKLIIIIFCCLSTLFATANDGVFYAEGNQLIPITETDISVRKEVLTINRVDKHLEVTVYYEFFNPVGEKELLVGFEAMSAYNGHDPMATFPAHPHIRNFKVVMNGEPLHYEIAHVTGMNEESTNYARLPYVKNGQIQSWTRKQCEESISNDDYMEMPFDYVYHFKAKFRPGINTIQHTYDFDLSSSVEEIFSFPYVLTAANRWANHQINDFTLNINLGNRESFHVFPTFFETADEWKIVGKGNVTIDTVWGAFDGMRTPVFHIQEGGISFHKANFHPEGELNISQRRDWTLSVWEWSELDIVDTEDLDAAAVLYSLKEQYFPTQLPSECKKEYRYYTIFSSKQRRILKNLPFAYRGYIFKDKALQDYFKSTNWYTPNPEYKADMETLSAQEKMWVEFWK